VTEKGTREWAAREMGRLVKTYGGPVAGDPITILQEELARTNGHVLWLGEQVTQNSPDELAHAFWEYRRSTEVPAGFKETVEQQAGHGYVGVWLDLYMKERAHLAKLCQMAIALGLEERKIRLNEAMAAAFAEAVTGLLSDFGIDPSLPANREKAYVRMAQAGAFVQLQIEASPTAGS